MKKRVRIAHHLVWIVGRKEKERVVGRIWMAVDVDTNEVNVVVVGVVIS